MDKIEAKAFPLDVDTLAKGSYLSEKRISEITSVSMDDEKFCFAKLRLYKWIEDELRARDRHWTVTMPEGGIRVLTDSEASVHNKNKRKRALKEFARRVFLHSQVDTGNLTATEQKEHERESYIQSRISSAIAGVKTRLRIGQK